MNINQSEPFRGSKYKRTKEAYDFLKIFFKTPADSI